MTKIDPRILDEEGELTARKRNPARTTAGADLRAGKPMRSDHVVMDEILKHSALRELGEISPFTPTYEGARYERTWILNYLGAFYDDGQILDVLYKVRGGKEANVYCCEAHPDTGLNLLAAKVYRPRMFRNLRNDARYRQSRVILDESGKRVKDSRLLHAIQKGTDVGKEALHTSWLQHEYTTLQMLAEAGADVPKPVAFSENTILMEYLGDRESGAPALNQILLETREARRLFDRLIHNVEVALRCNRVHGDLSAYNVLYWQGDCRIIDFPQAVDPRTNPDAGDIFTRDVVRLCQYFSHCGVRADGPALARALWERWVKHPAQLNTSFLDQDDEEGQDER